MVADFSAEAFTTWIGHSECFEDEIARRPLIGLSACLDRDDPPPEEGAPVPPGRHWLYFLPTYRTADGGYDGHAQLGTSLPPIPLRRRMWAGGRLFFHQPLRVGETAKKVSTIKDIAIKPGRSGMLAFVTVRHEISGSRGLSVVEEQDIVYRETNVSPAGTPPEAPSEGQFSHRVRPGPLLLFRYSALTFNGHRIHYDRGFCAEEGYPGLVVHGPLTATLMLDLVRDGFPGRTIGQFTFRAISPLFDTGDFTVNGKREGDGDATLWATSSAGVLAMSGHVRFA